jgi:hypothetical protein
MRSDRLCEAGTRERSVLLVLYKKTTVVEKRVRLKQPRAIAKWIEMETRIADAADAVEAGDVYQDMSAIYDLLDLAKEQRRSEDISDGEVPVEWSGMKDGASTMVTVHSVRREQRNRRRQDALPFGRDATMLTRRLATLRDNLRHWSWWRTNVVREPQHHRAPKLLSRPARRCKLESLSSLVMSARHKAL